MVGLGVAACGGEPAGLTQAAEILPNPGSTGSSPQDEPEDNPAVGSTGAGWGGDGSTSEGEGPSSGGSHGAPAEPDPDPGPDGNTVVSGSRLHRRALATPDGATSEVGLWDSELEVPCTFERAGDGEQRCMPKLPGEMMFSDPECTQPVIASYWSCEETDFRYARDYLGESDCEWTIETFEAIEGEVPAQIPVFSDWTGECAAQGSRLAVPAQPMADDALIRATFIEQPRAAGMSMRILLADDGAVWPDEVLDEGRAERCKPDAQSGRCIPASSAGFGHWSTLLDAACEQRVVAVDACDGSALRGRESVCDPWSLYEYGDEVDAAGVSLLGEDGVCEAAEGATGTHVTVGPLIPVETFPAVETVTVGEGRLREQRLVDAAGDSLATSTWGRTLYDTELGERCAPRWTADGVIRCLPPAASLSSLPLFADDDCTQRVVRGYSAECEVPATILSYAVQDEGCSGASSIYELGEALDTEEVYWELGGCSLAEHFIDNIVFFRVGEEIPIEAFVELDYVVQSP